MKNKSLSFIVILNIVLLFNRLVSADEDENSNAQRFLRQPVDQVALQGTHVTLPCRVQNKRGTLQWTRNGFGLGVERNLTGFDRYRMTGSDEEGDYTLDIKPVMLEDDAQFQCQVGAAPGVDPIRSIDAKLTVTVAPQEPEIINGNELRTTEDREVLIKCVSKGGKPAAEITWVHSSGKAISEDEIIKSTEPVENTKRVTAKSELRFIAQKKHHNTTFTCEAQNTADPLPKKASIKVFVEYAPDVKVTSDTENIVEGNDVTFTCNAHANPPRMTFRWFIDNALIPGNHGRELILPKINRKQNGKIVKCEVSNSIGKSEETETLDINYAPEFVLRPKDVSGERDQQATLSCIVDGNPTPSYTWFRQKDLQTVIGYEQNLSVRIGPSTVGNYVCRASVEGFSEIQHKADVLMKGPPRIIRRDQIQFGVEGDTVQITCEAFSIPPPQGLHWSLYSFPIDTASSHYSLMETGKKDGMKSTLVIGGSISSDFGEYNCTVKNQFGEDSFVITLQRKKSLPLIIIISAIIGGILLTMIAFFIMIFCRKNSSFKSKMSNTSDNKAGSSSGMATSSGKPTASSITAESEALMNPTTKLDFVIDGDESYDTDNTNPNLQQQQQQQQADLRYIQGNQFEDFQNRQNNDNMVGFIPNDNGYGYGLAGYAGYAQPPPPPHPNQMMMGGDPFYNRGLNVTDPRYMAKYGNPYLRSNPNQQQVQPVQQPVQSTANPPRQNGAGAAPNNSSPMMNRYNNNRPYNTLNTRNTAKPAAAAANFSPVHHDAPIRNGTLTKNNGKNGISRVMPVDGGTGMNEYILSPESEGKPGALATHV